MCRKTVLSLSIAICAFWGLTSVSVSWAQEPSITLTDAERNQAAQIGTFKDGLRAKNSGNDKRAVDIWLPLAQNGHARAQFTLGYMYSQGIYFKQDAQKAAFWWEMAGENGYTEAQQALGMLLYLGTPTVPKNPTRAAKWNKLAADGGSAYGQLYTGVQYGMGNGVFKDMKLAQKYLQMAVAQGNVEAAKMLAAVNDELASGTGSAEYQKGMIAYAKGNFKKARKILERAAKAGDAKSQFVVGTMVQLGQGGKKSHRTAVQWFEKAATQNHPKAQSALGLAYLQGRGVKRDDAKAFALIQKAADQGEPTAYANLGFAYANGRGVTVDYKKAVDLYEKAVEAGLPAAQFGLGDMVEKGLGVPQSDAVAAKLYQMAVDQDYPDAMVSLGILAVEGRGVDRDDQRAVQLFQKAAEHGSALGAVRLGTLYLSGRGVAQNAKVGAGFIEQGAEAGDPWGMYMTSQLYQSGTGVTKNNITALAWLKKASNAGYAAAQTLLSVKYEYGDGVTANANERDKWIKHASNSGFAEAQYWRANFYTRSGKFDKAKAWYEKAFAQGYEDAGSELRDISSGKAQADYKARKKHSMAEARARRAKERGDDPWGFKAINRARGKACRANAGKSAWGYHDTNGTWRCP